MEDAGKRVQPVHSGPQLCNSGSSKGLWSQTVFCGRCKIILTHGYMTETPRKVDIQSILNESKSNFLSCVAPVLMLQIKEEEMGGMGRDG